MKLFLDTSVLLAACGSAQGSSRALFPYAPAQGWELMASPWVIGEVTRNLVKFPTAGTADWLRLRRQLVIVDDVVSLDRALVFPVSKDRPVLLSALASAQVPITLDREDFMECSAHSVTGCRFCSPTISSNASVPPGGSHAGRAQNP